MTAILAEHAPKFPEAVATAVEHHMPVLMTVQAFRTQPDLLVVALRYASMAGATVQFKPALASDTQADGAEAA